MKFHQFGLISLVLTMNIQASPLSPDVIYGEDNRIDTFESKSPLHKKLAQSTAAMIPPGSIRIRGTTAELLGEALSDYTPQGLSQPVCQKEKFSAQPLVAGCSGFLVADNILATAGHCMTSLSDCSSYKWVFNYKVNSRTQSAVSVAASDVFSCKRIIKQALTATQDFALIELDRALPGKALKLAKSTPAAGTPIVMIGYPSGLPQKITENAKVASATATGFLTDLDAFQGNSGSSVFNAVTGEIVGILVNGNQDYRHNKELNCSEVNVLPSSKAGEGVSSVMQFSAFVK